MKKSFERVISVCLTAAMLAGAGSTAITASADSTAISDEEALLIERRRFADYGTGAVTFDLDELDEENLIGSVSEYKEFANIAPKGRKRAMAASPAGSSLPDSVDNTTNENARFFPPIDTQGSIGSCCAWATTYYQYTYMVNKARGISASSVNKYSPTWTYNLVNNGSNSGCMPYEVYEAIKTMGAAKATDVKIQTSKYTPSNYLSWHATDDVWAKALENRLTDYSFFKTTVTTDYGYSYQSTYPVNPSGTPVTSNKDSDLDAMKTALSNGDILCFITYVNSWDYKTIKESTDPGVDNSFVGDIAASVCDGYDGCHEMTIVGYNDNIWIDINNNDRVDSGEMGAFKIVNSWGTSYRNKGFCWVAYDALNEKSAVSGVTNGEERECIFDYVSTIKVDDKDYSSDMYLRCELNSANRYETVTEVTATNKATGETTVKEISPYGINNYAFASTNDRSYNYLGKTGACDGVLYFDLNNVVEDLSVYNINDYNWTVKVYDKEADSSELVINSLKIVDYSDSTEYDITNGQTYTLNDNYCSFSLGDIVFPFAVSMKVSPKMNFGIGEIAKLNVKAHGGAEPYEYKYELTRYGQTTLLSDFSHASSYQTQLFEVGPYFFKVTVRDAEGNTKTVSDNITVNQTYILDLKCNKSNPKVGDALVITPDTLNLASVMTPDCFNYTVTKDGVSQTYSASAGGKLNWTPVESGEYNIKCDLVYNGEQIYTVNRDFTVDDGGITIYYKGYSDPYIHYQVEGGSWTSVPGVQMTPISNASGYTHKYTISLNGRNYANVCFNDGHNNWDSNNGSNYRFYSGKYTFENGVISEYVPGELSASLTLSASEIVVNNPVTLTAAADNGTAPYTYKFVEKHNGQEYTVKDYSSSDTAEFTPFLAGTFYVTAFVKDSRGNVASVMKTLTVKAPHITSVTPSAATPNVGESVQFTAAVDDEVDSLTYKFSAERNNQIDEFYTGSSKTASWTPSQTGEYMITVKAYHNGTLLSSASTYVVAKKAPEKNAVIFYKGFSAPYIHYQVGTGNWTAVPGVAMTASGEVEGYTHKYTIDLGTADYANVCFNDGGSNWDSNNGSNYRFTEGVFTFSNGTITEFNGSDFGASLSLPAHEVLAGYSNGSSMPISVTAWGGTAPYTYKFTKRFADDANAAEQVVRDYSSDSSASLYNPGGYATRYGDYVITAYVMDAEGNVATVSDTVNFKLLSATVKTNKDSASVGETVELSLETNGTLFDVYNRFTVVNSDNFLVFDSSSEDTAEWTPSEAGTYTITGYIYNDGDTRYHIISASKEFTVTDTPANSVVIYYKGYSTPNIHYQVEGGSWTAVPGVAMTATNEVEGYTHKYTIDLGSASYANVCFNDGHNNWDSNNGANYRFNSGTYKYSNGTITAM